MRQGFNQFSIPYMNELLANQYGAASQFNGNMPLGFVNYSMDIINSFFQNPNDPKTGRPEDFEEVIINGKKVLRRKTTQLGQILGLPPTTATPTTPPINPQGNCPPGQVEYKDIFGYKHCGTQMQSDTTPEERKAAGIKTLENPFSSLFELSNKTVIILVGIVILIAALVSLR